MAANFPGSHNPPSGGGPAKYECSECKETIPTYYDDVKLKKWSFVLNKTNFYVFCPKCKDQAKLCELLL